MLQICRAQIANCISGDRNGWWNGNLTIRNQRKANATDYIQKAWIQRIKFLSMGKAEAHALCMTALGISFFYFFKFVRKKKSSFTWSPEKHLWCDAKQSMGFQTLVAAAQIRKALKSSWAFQTSWAWSLLFRLLPPPLPLRLPSPSSRISAFRGPAVLHCGQGKGHPPLATPGLAARLSCTKSGIRHLTGCPSPPPGLMPRPQPAKPQQSASLDFTGEASLCCPDMLEITKGVTFSLTFQLQTDSWRGPKLFCVWCTQYLALVIVLTLISIFRVILEKAKNAEPWKYRIIKTDCHLNKLRNISFELQGSFLLKLHVRCHGNVQIHPEKPQPLLAGLSPAAY